MREIVRTWPDTVVLDLTRNHRSTAHIVAVADTLLEERRRRARPRRSDDGEVPHRARIRHRRGGGRARRDLARGQAPAGQSVALHGRAGAHQRPARGRRRLPGRRGHPQRAARPRALAGVGPAPRRRTPRGAFDEDPATPSRSRRSTGPRGSSSPTSRRSAGPRGCSPTTTRPARTSSPRSSASPTWRSAAPRTRCFITWSRGRNDPRYPDRAPSRFLAGVEPAVAEIEARNAPLTGEARRARLAAIRRDLEGADR